MVSILRITPNSVIIPILHLRRKRHREVKALSQRQPAYKCESQDSNSGRLTWEPTLLAQASVTDSPSPRTPRFLQEVPHTEEPGFRLGRDRQAHLDLGQDSDYGYAETENEVEADEDLALVAGARLGVVDEQ